MRIHIALKRIFFTLFLYSLLRIVFLALNTKSFLKFSPDLIFQCFIEGIRFDFASIVALNVPILFITVLVSKKIYQSKLFQRFIKFLFVGMNFPFILMNLIDSEYYKFTGTRMTAEVFMFKSEALHQTHQFVFNYWHILFLAGIYLVVLFRFYPKAHPMNTESMKPLTLKALQFSFSSLSLILVFVLGFRGGLQAKPLHPSQAYLAGHAELGALTLNSTFTLLKSKPRAHLSPLQYFKNQREVLRILEQKPFQFQIQGKNQNVVILILESFATEFWGAANTYKGYTPFLDSLAQKGLFFKNNFANGRRSIDALPSIIMGLPPLMSTPVVRSNYYSNFWHGLGSSLKNNKYHVSFFHGAPRGTMYFDAISALAGFDDYYPLERYGQKGNFDGNWGIYDEPFLQYMIQELNKHPEPFLSTAFTISSHQPYHVPPEYEGKFPKGTLKIHASIGYVDYALKQFFEAASKEPWFNNTLFIITGDHTQMSESEHYNTTLGRFRVPLLLYHPKLNLKVVNPNRVTQHTDIVPSILDFLGIKNELYLPFGRSVFDESQPGEALFFSDNNYWLIRQDYFLRFSESENKSYLYSIDDPNQLHALNDQEDTRQALETRIKAYLQLYRNGLIDNTIYCSPLQSDLTHGCSKQY